MLEGLASQIYGSYGIIPVISKNRGVLELGALVGELCAWIYQTDVDSSKERQLTFLTTFKTIQITACLGSVLFFTPLNGYYYSEVILATVATVYVHTTEKNPDNAFMHNLVGAVARSYNVFTKVINSFAIGQMAHRAVFNDQKTGAFMLVTTVSVFGLSTLNAIADWYTLGQLRGDQI